MNNYTHTASGALWGTAAQRAAQKKAAEASAAKRKAMADRLTASVRTRHRIDYTPASVTSGGRLKAMAPRKSILAETDALARDETEIRRRDRLSRTYSGTRTGDSARGHQTRLVHP